MEYFLSSKNLLNTLLFIVVFFVNPVNSKYPEDCAANDSNFCYVLEKTPMTYEKAKENCSARGGVTAVDNTTDSISRYSLHIGNRKFTASCYWTFNFEDFELCYWIYVETNCNPSCYSTLPSICKIPSKECRLTELRKSIPNAYFRNCKERSLPMHEITVKCKEGYILQKGPNIVRCHFDGKWSHTPECRPGCLKPKVSNNSYLLSPKEKYEVGEKAEIWCNKNFISLGNYPITSIVVSCLNIGFWSDSLPECLPVKDLFYHYDFTKNKYYKKRIAVGDNITLQVCKLENPFYEGLDKSISWLKDQVEFTGLQGGQTFLNQTDFKLQFFNFSMEDEGIYSCIIKDKITSSVLDFCLYQLQVSNECPQESLEHSVSLNLLEGTNQIITCSTSTTIYKVIWFKDERRIWGDNNHIPMPDGSLYFRNISVLDEGKYICTYKDLQSSCERKSEITVTIIQKMICGRLDEQHSTKLSRPWLATLWNEGELMPFCYATLIDSTWLVTSATCLSGFQRKQQPDFLVKLGATLDSLETTSIYEVLTVRMHPKYSKRHRLYDIGVIKLKDNVIYTNDIYPICYFGSNLHEENSCNEFQSGTTTGWGPLESVREISKVKLSSEMLNIVNSTECNYFIRSKLPDYIFCAKGMDGVHDFAGDSGSSFEIKWKNHWYLWGVMSWGDRVTEIGDFDYFTKMIYFEDWVQSIIES